MGVRVSRDTVINIPGSKFGKIMKISRIRAVIFIVPLLTGHSVAEQQKQTINSVLPFVKRKIPVSIHVGDKDEFFSARVGQENGHGATRCRYTGDPEGPKTARPFIRQGCQDREPESLGSHEDYPPGVRTKISFERVM